LGYLTDAISILATSTVGSLTAIDAYVPSVLPGGGSHIRLDITGAFDSTLNATTSIYKNSSASSTQTFYQITSYYWNLLIYIALAIFLLSRILGSHIIGRIGNKLKK